MQNRKKNKDSQAPAGVEKLIYSSEKLLHLITKRRLIEHEIQESRKHFYSSPCCKDQENIHKFEEQIRRLQVKKKELFNITKLRRTVIYGIPCKFIQFVQHSKDVTDQLLN